MVAPSRRATSASESLGVVAISVTRAARSAGTWVVAQPPMGMVQKRGETGGRTRDEWPAPRLVQDGRRRASTQSLIWRVHSRARCASSREKCVGQ